MSSVPRVCSACGAASAWDANFCQQCGRRLDRDRSTPRYYGVLSPGPAFVLGVVLLVAGVIALAAWSALAAILLLALAAVSLVFFFEAARRKPYDRVARGVFAVVHHTRGWLTFAATLAAAWARATGKLVRLRLQKRSLRRQREPTLRSLGDAAYREDESLVKALQERVREIDGELAKRERAREETLAAARRHVEDERESAQQTRRLRVDDIASADSDES